MSSETKSSVSRVVWAGRILVFLGLTHLVITGVVNAAHVPEWFDGALWTNPATDTDLRSWRRLGEANGAFWMVWGSFAAPQILLGGLLARLGRSGYVPPTFVAVGLGCWGLIAAALTEPTPFITVLIPVGMLLAARRSGRRISPTGHSDEIRRPARIG